MRLLSVTARLPPVTRHSGSERKRRRCCWRALHSAPSRRCCCQLRRRRWRRWLTGARVWVPPTRGSRGSNCSAPAPGRRGAGVDGRERTRALWLLVRVVIRCSRPRRCSVRPVDGHLKGSRAAGSWDRQRLASPSAANGGVGGPVYILEEPGDRVVVVLGEGHFRGLPVAVKTLPDPDEDAKAVDVACRCVPEPVGEDLRGRGNAAGGTTRTAP